MRVIWATRGRTWGFRFLRDGGFQDPLPEYDRAFSGLGDQPTACVRIGGAVALRFPDLLRREDKSGRVILHEFVVYGPLAARIHSVDDGILVVWPEVAEEYLRIWQQPWPLPVRGQALEADH